MVYPKLLYELDINYVDNALQPDEKFNSILFDDKYALQMSQLVIHVLDWQFLLIGSMESNMR